MSTANPKFEFTELDGDARLKELILYIARKSQVDPRFGAIKLNKILFFSDQLAYARFGRPITGTKYQRLRRGPAPVRLLPIREQLLEAGAIVIQESAYRGKKQDRVIALRPAKLDAFTGGEIAIVDQVIRDLWPLNGAECSLVSHDIAWKIARDGDLIPYQSAFLDEATVTDDDVARAKELAQEHGWKGV